MLVAEDGTAMRLAVMLNNQPAKLLMQITRGNSEITGPALTPDGSRLYFGSQRGPSGANGTGVVGRDLRDDHPAALPRASRRPTPSASASA